MVDGYFQRLGKLYRREFEYRFPEIIKPSPKGVERFLLFLSRGLFPRATARS
jgi:hypothetical protein